MGLECNKEATSLKEAIRLAAMELQVNEEELEYEILSQEDLHVAIRAWFQNSEDEKDEISEEELDRIADTAIEVLRSILVHFDAADTEIDEYDGDDGEIILDVIGSNLAILIGRYGKTLEALQLLVSAIVNRKIGYRFPIVVDVEGYKHRRRQKIESLAHSAAKRAQQGGAEVRLRPMTPYERRLVHIALRDEKNIETYSEGEEPNRRIVIRSL